MEAEPENPEPESEALEILPDLSAKDMEHVECLHLSVAYRLIYSVASIYAHVWIVILQFDV
jgi:hypothetical protein